MQIHSLPDIDGSSCTLIFDQDDQWLRAIWRGFVDPQEAMRGAQSYLASAEAMPCPYLLNDNVALHGPWFDSLDWLQEAWLPHAQRLGLRFVAHVVQADTHHDILSFNFPEPLVGELELQVFHNLAAAEFWLRSCQQRSSEQMAA